MAAKVENSLSGYFINIKIIGTRDEIDAEIEKIQRQYPPQGYSTWFNWPPHGPNRNYKPPIERNDGLWEAKGERATSCE